MSRRSRQKRQIKRKVKPKNNRSKLRWYPTMFCTGENLYIGISQMAMKFKGDRWGNIKPKYKIIVDHWKPDTCKFRSQEYVIDLSGYTVGLKVKCSKCGSDIDFRLFGSNTIPSMIEVQNDKKGDSKGFTEAQETDN